MVKKKSAKKKVLLTPLQMRRKSHGLSQVEIAAAAGISLKHYQNVEHYKVMPTVIIALRIAIVMRTSVEALWGDIIDA
jgi:DNA-binding XRE family transcriptional regulator